MYGRIRTLAQAEMKYEIARQRLESILVLERIDHYLKTRAEGKATQVAPVQDPILRPNR
jgi:hypothetical protein